jgi:hypothetical protein
MAAFAAFEAMSEEVSVRGDMLCLMPVREDIQSSRSRPSFEVAVCKYHLRKIRASTDSLDLSISGQLRKPRRDGRSLWGPRFGYLFHDMVVDMALDGLEARSIAFFIALGLLLPWLMTHTPSIPKGGPPYSA